MFIIVMLFISTISFFVHAMDPLTVHGDLLAQTSAEIKKKIGFAVPYQEIAREYSEDLLTIMQLQHMPVEMQNIVSSNWNSVLMQLHANTYKYVTCTNITDCEQFSSMISFNEKANTFCTKCLKPTADRGLVATFETHEIMQDGTISSEEICSDVNHFRVNGVHKLAAEKIDNIVLVDDGFFIPAQYLLHVNNGVIRITASSRQTCISDDASQMAIIDCSNVFHIYEFENKATHTFDYAKHKPYMVKEVDDFWVVMCPKVLKVHKKIAPQEVYDIDLPIACYVKQCVRHYKNTVLGVIGGFEKLFEVDIAKKTMNAHVDPEIDKQIFSCVEIIDQNYIVIRHKSHSLYFYDLQNKFIIKDLLECEPSPIIIAVDKQSDIAIGRKDENSQRVDFYKPNAPWETYKNLTFLQKGLTMLALRWFMDLDAKSKK